MHLILLCLGVLSSAYLGDCQITAWTEPNIAGAKDGTHTYTDVTETASGTVKTLAATGQHASAPAFTIVSQTTAGKLTLGATDGVLALGTNQFFDYEVTPTYVIVVTGLGTDSTTGTITITFSITDVANDASYGTSYTSFYRLDDAAAASTTVATIAATGGTSTTYSILAGNTNTDFTYASATGVLTTANAMSRSTTPHYALTLAAVAVSVTSTAQIVVCVGTAAQCGCSGSGAAGLQISLIMLLVAIVTSRIK